MRCKLLAGAALAAISAGSAFAADLAVKAVAPAPVYNWSGVYIGGVIGGGWSTHDVSDQALGPLLGAPYAQGIAASGMIGGVDGGARYQLGKLVVGVEGDMTWGNLNGTNANAFGPDSFTVSRAITADTKWTATAAATFGTLLDPAVLLYGKAGIAFANTGYTDSWAVPGMFSPSAERRATPGPVGRPAPASSGRFRMPGRSRPSTTISISGNTTSRSASNPWVRP